MKITKTNGWSISADGEQFYGTFDSRDAAVATVKNDYGCGYIGIMCKIEFECCDFQWDASYELSKYLYEEIGDAAEFWDFTATEEFQLVQIMGEAMVKFLNENNLQPKVCKVIDIEYIDDEETNSVPKLTSVERELCKALKSGFLARDEDKLLCLYKTEPFQEDSYWTTGVINDWTAVDENLFQFITWESGKAWSIEDLLKLEVEE